MEQTIVERHLIENMVNEERKIEYTDDEEGITEEINKGPSLATAPERLSMETNSKYESSLSEKDQKEQLKSTKAEMGEVREENERLKRVLAQIVTDYQSLKTHFFEIVKQEASKISTDTDRTREEDEENELVSLSLGGRHSSEQKKNEKKTLDSISEDEQDEKFIEGPKLGLDCRFEPSATELVTNPSPENRFEEQKEEEHNSETRQTGKTLKTMRSGEDELLQPSQLKRARVSVRARCDTPTMNDGCQWRKYGQKIAKGNPCPRAYYRCTVSPSCPVRKQVQRCAEDMTILITTYEGTHNHPLPMSATAMASTTSAAASMLQSGSSTSQPSHGASFTAIATSNTTNLHGFNFNSKVPHQFYLPNSSISKLNSHPTITLDLTAPPTTNRFSSAPRYPSTCLNFSSTTASSSRIQSSRGGGYISYGIPYHSGLNQVGYSASVGRQPPPQEHFYNSYIQKSSLQNHSQATLTESTVVAATKAAIASNPTFRSALEAAITSLVSNNGGGGGGGGAAAAAAAAAGGDEIKSGHNMKWGY